MATTTNYSWTTPDDTALVKDGAAAIRTLGSSVDTTVKALNPGTTAGDIDYYTTSTAKARIAIGTAGQVLTVNSGATAPEWKSLSAGKVLQVVSASTTSAVTITATSFQDSGLSASITPSSATSKVLILITQPAYNYRAANGFLISSQILRGATQIAFNDKFARFLIQSSNNNEAGYNAAFSYLDSPATTSSTTYKTQYKTDGNGATVELQSNSSTSQIILMEIGA